jgi:hypothetical protein
MQFIAFSHITNCPIICNILRLPCLNPHLTDPTHICNATRSNSCLLTLPQLPKLYNNNNNNNHHCQNSFFEAIAFLRRFCQISHELNHPVFPSLDLSTVILLQSKVVNLASNSQPGEPGLSFYAPQ